MPHLILNYDISPVIVENEDGEPCADDSDVVITLFDVKGNELGQDTCSNLESSIVETVLFLASENADRL